MEVVSSLFTFPNICWWMKVADSSKVILDCGEHFQKMSYRNRYRISGANNSILLSVPLLNGRNQRLPMSDVQIYNGERWQVQHWRTLVSVYKRSPFFDHYELGLMKLYETEYERLCDFNLASIEWVRKQLRLNFEIELAGTYINDYGPDVTDIRVDKTAPEELPKYLQIFEDRIGFLPDLSILDLLFMEGPMAAQRLKKCD